MKERSPDTRLPKVLNFMRAMWGIDHGLQAMSKRMHSTLGITGPQRIVIRIVGRFPGISAGQLAEILHLHPSTLTGVLARLQALGALKRTNDRSDGRRALFTLTAKGKKYDAPNPATVEAVVERALTRFGNEEVEIARQVFDALATALLKDS